MLYLHTARARIADGALGTRLALKVTTLKNYEMCVVRNENLWLKFIALIKTFQTWIS